VGPVGFLVLVVLLAVVWLMFVLPARRRRASHMDMQDSIEIGDEIITAGGLHAIVTELDDQIVWVEIADGVVAKLDRRAVAAVAREIEVEVDRDDAEGEDGVKRDEGEDEAPPEDPVRAG
jgi:preprotein translocase subunit YajC